MQEEIWKDVKGYQDYQVSDFGRVKSFKRGAERILKSSPDTNGYLCVGLSLTKDSYTKKERIHQLVAESFFGHVRCGHNLVIDHINNIKSDNRVENLQIVTNRYNVCKVQGRYSSQYKGVYWCKQQKKWVARIYIDGRYKPLGAYKVEYEAHLAYQKALNAL